MNKKYTKACLFSLLAILLILTGYYLSNESHSTTKQKTSTLISPLKPIKLEDIEQKSTIGIKENIAARSAYENNMLANPKTGKIPNNIKKLSRIFTEKISNKASINSRLYRPKGNKDSDWIANGPFSVGGRTRALAIDVLDNDILLAGGTSGGMWRSIDQGNSWGKVTAPQALHSVTCIAQDKRNGKENTWYYGTGELIGNSARGGGGAFYRGDGIFKSTDSGLTWTLLTSTSEAEPNRFSSGFQFIWDIKTNPLNRTEDEVVAATFGGIQRSTDGGISWNFVLGQANNNSSLYTDIAITNQGVYYASLSSSSPDGNSIFAGIYRSTDAENWTQITPQGFAEEYDRVVIGISEQNPNEVFFLTASEPNELWKYTYLSGNGSGSGGSWNDLTTNIPMFGGSVGDFDSQGSYNMMISVHPSNEDIVYLGGTNLYRSTDGFSSTNNIAWIGGYNNINDITDYPGHHPDQHELLFFAGSSSKVVSAHDGGLSISEDILAQNVTWNSINNGYITSQYYAIAQSSEAGNNGIVGGLQDNGSYLSLTGDANGNWGRILGGDGGYAAFAHDGANIYVSSQFGRIIRYFRQDNEFIPVSRIDASKAGKRVGQELLFINPFIIDPYNNSKMYLAGGDRIWVNPNVTQIPGASDSTALNWIDIPQSSIPSGSITSLAISTVPRDILYFGSEDGLLRKIENVSSLSPQVTNMTASNFPAGGYVSCIAIDPSNANNLIVVFSNYNVISLYYSDNGGQSFTNIAGNLEENADGSGNGPSTRWATIIPKTNNQYTYLVGTSSGLFSTELLNGENTVWEQEGEDIIGNVVVPMMQYRPSDGRVLVATHGNGIYSKTIDNALPIEINPSSSQFELSQNFPNPFSNITKIGFKLPMQSVARLRVFDSQGKKVRTLLLTTQFEGENEVIWDGKDGNGVPVKDGIYYYRLEYGVEKFSDATLTKKLILIR